MRIKGDPVAVLGAQIERVAAYAETWLLSTEMYELAQVLRQAANQLDQAANDRRGVGRRA